MTQFALRFISGKYQGGEFPLRMEREIVIGRSSDLDMVLVEDMVSRKHAKIATMGNQIVIQDNGRGVSAEKEGRLDRGHGMSSMKSRAKQMQGQCLVESGPGLGTLIRLNIPV